MKKAKGNGKRMKMQSTPAVRASVMVLGANSSSTTKSRIVGRVTHATKGAADNLLA
jgi:hypothetical protein